MCANSKIYKIIILMLFIYILSAFSVNGANNELNESEDTNKKADLINASSYLEEYNEEYKGHPLFIASRGTFPKTIDQQWENLVSKCWLSISTKRSVVEFDPSVYAIGSAGELLTVHLGSAYHGKINESKIDEIYLKIEHYCEQETGISGIPVVFMWAQDDEDMSLPDYGPAIFEEAKSNPSVIAVYGTMPVIEQESEKREWTDLLGHSKGKELDPFFAEFGGPVLGYGVSINGYLSVGMDLENPEKVNESVIDEIYQTISRHFEQEAGINEVPVVFVWEPRAVTDELLENTPSPDNEHISMLNDDGSVTTYTADEAYIDEDGNVVIIDNENTSESNTQTTPGFTSIMLALCLLILGIYRK
ncbi:MAG: hypothetical protein RBT65_09345 [Methanolobus sp.]|nr:hypothetical protein [Methanolobus sp.]